MVEPEKNRRRFGLSKGAAVAQLQLSLTLQEMHLVLQDLLTFKKAEMYVFM